MAVDALGEPLADQLDLDGHAALFTHMACAGLAAPRHWRVPTSSARIACTVNGQLARVADSIGDGRALLASASAASASALVLAVGAARVAHAVMQPGIYDAAVKALRLWLPPVVRCRLVHVTAASRASRPSVVRPPHSRSRSRSNAPSSFTRETR